MKKVLLTVLLFAAAILSFTACSSVSVVDETQIRSDLESIITSLEKSEKVINVTIENRETDLDESKDKIRCHITTEDNLCRYEKSIVVIYNLDEDDNWSLDDFTVSDRSQWSVSPLKGVNEDDTAASLNGISVTAGNEIWNVTQDNVRIVSIDKHETDLEAKTDKITATVAVDDAVEEARGQLVIDYTFNDEWVVKSISGNGDFEASIKPGLELNVTDETLINAISEQTFDYGRNINSIHASAVKVVPIVKDGVTDFSIEGHESSEKGKLQEYICKCKLKSKYAEFNLDIGIQYCYDSDDGWVLQPISVEAECYSVSIEGKWTGIRGGDSCELNIIEMDTEGNITASYINYGNAYKDSYSYYLSGKIDFNTLIITLEAGDWINKPTLAYKSDIQAQLNVDASTITGREGYSAFSVAQ